MCRFRLYLSQTKFVGISKTELISTNYLKIEKNFTKSPFLKFKIKFFLISRMIEHLIIDAGGFIRDAPIREMCKNAYTIPQVVAEIKDRTTRNRLKVLPYELKFRLRVQKFKSYFFNFQTTENISLFFEKCSRKNLRNIQ